jgi:uncharacterized protein YjbI with pentapeptide repeats
MAQGKEAWNSWARQMLAEKSPILADKAWADRARADFGGVNFNEDCDFAGLVFPGQAEFWPALKKAGRDSRVPTCFHKRVSFDGAKFLGMAWFAGAVFKDEASFREAEFAGWAQFTGAIFGGNVWFNRAKFDATLSDNLVLFDEVRFEADASFEYAAFAGHGSFGRATFSGAAMFCGASGLGSFAETVFLSDADFREVTGRLSMDHAKFAGDAYFQHASLRGANFQKASFTKAAHFDRAAFPHDATFRGAVFKQEANFSGIRSEAGFEVEFATFLKLPNFDDASFSERAPPDPRILAEPKPGKRSKEPRYFEIYSDYCGKLLCWELENIDRLQTNGRRLTAPEAWPDGYLQSLRGPWNLPDYLERPRFVIDEKNGRLPRDLEVYDGVFFVSKAMKAVLEALDPGACDIRPCDTVLSSGEPGPELWLCSITRAFIGAIDFERSAISVSFFADNGLPMYGLGGNTKIRFKPEVINGAYLFHAAELSGYVFCDEPFKQACKDAGLKGLRFASHQ